MKYTTQEYKEAQNFSWWQVIKSLWFFLEVQRVKFIILTTILFICYLYQIVPSFIIGRIIDFFTNHKPNQSLLPFYGYILVFGIGWTIIGLTRLTIKTTLNAINVTSRYTARVKGFERLLDFSMRWHEQENTGNKVQRIQTGTMAMGNLFNLMANDLFVAIAGVVGVMGAFLLMQPLFALFGVIYLIVFLGIQASFYKKIKLMSYEYNILIEQSSGKYFEGLSNVLTLKTLGVKDSFKKNIISQEVISRDFYIKRNKLSNDKWKTFQIFNAITFMIVIYYIGQGVLARTISIGSIFIIFSYFNRLWDSATNSIQIIDQLVDIKTGIARMMPIYWEKIIVREGTLTFPNNWRIISIVNGNFSYETGNNLLQSNHSHTNEDQPPDNLYSITNLTFTVNKYEKIGIVGHSGSGKSTLAKILLGLYDLNNGKFTIDHTNYYELKHNEITKNIAIVLQETEMFNLSLKDNITLMRDWDSKLFEKAIKIAQLEEMISTLPLGIDTLIGEKGYKVSGGERQRIGIARAIYKNSQVLVLDEATSSLDSKTESRIQEGLENELQRKTLIIIAHRISTLKNVDKIYVFDHGEIVEEGLYKDLLSNKKSKFYEVYQSQNINKEA